MSVGPSPPSGPRDGLATGAVAGEHVGAIDDHAGHVVAGGADGDVLDGRLWSSAGTLMA